MAFAPKTLTFALAAAALLGSAAAARADSLANANQLCTILDATGLLAAQCAISSWASSVGLLIQTTPAEAKTTCLAVRDIAKENGLAFDMQWKVEIHAPPGGAEPLAVCKLEQRAPTVESFGLRPATE